MENVITGFRRRVKIQMLDAVSFYTNNKHLYYKSYHQTTIVRKKSFVYTFNKTVLLLLVTKNWS